MHFWIRGWKCIKLAGTSRHWVNKCRSQQAATSRRLNVATLQRRDVSAIPASPSLKAKRGPEFEATEIVRTRARKSEQQRL